MIPRLVLVLLFAFSCLAEMPADRVYRNGTLFTATKRSAEAVAVRDGRIVYVGNNAGVAPFIAASTRVIDLKGRFLMPGLVDGHMHPLEAGNELLKCSLNYDRSPWNKYNSACRPAWIRRNRRNPTVGSKW